MPDALTLADVQRVEVKGKFYRCTGRASMNELADAFDRVARVARAALEAEADGALTEACRQVEQEARRCDALSSGDGRRGRAAWAKLAEVARTRVVRLTALRAAIRGTEGV